MFLTQIAGERSGNVFASTHSADFLSGCIQSGTPINVIRLTYAGGVATARVLLPDRLATLMRDPLLRSTGVMSSLFYRGAVVCESDTDRAFYAEVNDRLVRLSHDGIEDSIFLNAQNWQTCANIIAPLREMGIPAAAIVDLDVVLNDELSRLMAAAYVPPITASGLTQVRSRIKVAFEKKLNRGQGQKELARLVKYSGISCLDGQDREAADQFIADLRSYGLFLVPVGEVERWLPALGIEGHASRWLIPVFERMGANPDDASYVRPSQNDVWQFMRDVGAWVANPHRKGLPQ